jgi:hypothetical protein
MPFFERTIEMLVSYYEKPRRKEWQTCYDQRELTVTVASSYGRSVLGSAMKPKAPGVAPGGSLPLVLWSIRMHPPPERKWFWWLGPEVSITGRGACAEVAEGAVTRTELPSRG